MIEQYSHQYSITAADMDTGYRMTPSAVLLYYQDCWARYMGCLHLAAFDIVKKNLMWVISEFNAWTTGETVYWGDDIEVTVWNSEISALRVYAEFRITKTGGKEVAHGYGVWTLLDTVARRLAPNTPLAPMMTALPQFTTDGHKKHRFPTGGTLEQQIEHRVNPINLDFNGHVNNRTYLSIAMQTANEQFMNAFAIRSFAIHWLHETFLNDILTCSVYAFESGVYVHSIANREGKAVAEIYSEWVPRGAEPDVADIACRI
ncbi:MAG: hypothetical protein IJ249_00850 [Paludibacteraceae bacterium]|nr:hypothetical protein [Paludibacteraceae bacterium]